MYQYLNIILSAVRKFKSGDWKSWDMTSNQTNLLRKYGKTIFKLLEKRWIREVPLAEEERERDRFKEEEIKRKIVRAAIGRASKDDNRGTEREE